MKGLPLIVPDVNVLISGAVYSNNAPSQIVEAWKTGHVEFATSEAILNDLRRVFSYPRVLKLTQMTEQEINAYIQVIAEGAIFAHNPKPLQVSIDPDDDKLFACAVEVGADYIVSGDKEHVLEVGEYHGVQTISPRDFMMVLQEERKAA